MVEFLENRLHLEKQINKQDGFDKTNRKRRLTNYVVKPSLFSIILKPACVPLESVGLRATQS